MARRIWSLNLLRRPLAAPADALQPMPTAYVLDDPAANRRGPHAPPSPERVIPAPEVGGPPGATRVQVPPRQSGARAKHCALLRHAKPRQEPPKKPSSQI